MRERGGGGGGSPHTEVQAWQVWARRPARRPSSTRPCALGGCVQPGDARARRSMPCSTLSFID